MILSDLIDNDFDINCRVIAYDYSENDDMEWDDAPVVYDSDDWHSPLDAVLDMKISYMTIFDSILRIELKKGF